MNLLRIDLNNFRTVPQKNEISALRTMIAIAPEKFWGLMESLLEDGYLPNENVIVLKEKESGNLIVKEGNRRIGCLKLIHGLLAYPDMPSHIRNAIEVKDSDWLTENLVVPCAVYAAKDEAIVDRIVSLTHGKGQKAGRDGWETIARARHSRDKDGKSEAGLDLFEKFLQHSTNFSPDQAERWSGSYVLTVLDEAIKRAAPRFGVKTARELADTYPKVAHLKILNELIKDIGLETIRFNDIRNPNLDFFADRYGLADPSATTNTAGSVAAGSGAAGSGAAGSSGVATVGRGTKSGGASGSGTRGAGKAAPLGDPKSVKKCLKTYAPRGKEQHKLATLVDELKSLKVEQTPHAFCFVLRSIFEIAGKQYFEKNGLSLLKSGKDKTLFEILKESTAHLTLGKPKMDPMVKKLHGALHELGKAHGILSVTSMNQLVHNPRFSPNAGDICIVFHNVFPLLEEITRA